MSIKKEKTHSQHPPSSIFRYLLKTPQSNFSHFRNERNEDSIDKSTSGGRDYIADFGMGFDEH
jgi:hypothetical protein